MGLTRTTTGLLAADGFADLSNWTAASGWAADATRPTYVAYPSPVTQFSGGTVGSNDGSGAREAHAIISGTRWYLFYGAGDGNNSGANAPWKPQLAYSDDRGLTWTKLGPIATMSGGYAAYDSLFVLKYSGTYYYHVLHAVNQSNGIPSPAYKNAVYTASNIEGPYTYVRESPVLGTSGDFDDAGVSGSWLENIGGTWHMVYSAEKGSAYAIGHATASTPDGPYTKDGSGSFINSQATGSPENPKKWHSATLGKYVLIANIIGGTTTNANYAYFSDSATSFRGSEVYRNTIQFTGWDLDGSRTANPTAVGLLSPLVNEDGTVVETTDGFVPFFFDTDPSNADTHRQRKIRQGVLEPAASAAKYTAPDTSVRLISRSVSHSDFMCEFQFELDASASANSAGFHYRRSSAATTETGNGYLLVFDFGGNAVTLYRMDAGSFTLVTSAGYTWIRDGDVYNLAGLRFRVAVVGGNHKLYINSDTELYSATDSTYASGTAISFRAQRTCWIRNIHMRTLNTVTVSGCAASADVKLRGAGGVWMSGGTANAGGTATLTSVHYPAHSIEVAGVDYTAATGLIYGGDAFAFSATPVADFSGFPLSGASPLSVAFTDLSSGTVTSRLWEYSSDGGVTWGTFTNATQQNPTQTFN